MAGNLDTSITIRAGVEGLADLRQLINVIEQAGGDVTHLRQASEQLGNSWHNLSTDEQNRQLKQLGQSAQELARDTNRATEQMERFLGVRSNSSITSEIGQVNAALATLHDRLKAGTISQDEFNRMTAAGQARLNALQEELNQTAGAAARTEHQLGGLGGAMGRFQGLLAALGVSVGAAEIIQLADSFNQLESRVRLATGSGAAFATGMDGIKRIANATLTDLESTAALFSKLTTSGRELGLAQKDVLSLTETINQAMKVSGATTAEASSTILQFSQALSSGVIRGDEFNSIMENGGRLADAMAKGLGVTKGELRAMAEEGKLTASTVIEAIQSQKDAIAKDFGGMTLTVSDSVQTLKNNILSLIGDIDNSLNSSGELAQFIKDIGDGLTHLDPTTINAVKQAFSELGNIVKSLYDTMSDTYNSVSDLFSAFSGANAANEKVGLLTRSLQGISIIMGAIGDGVQAMHIVIDTVMGAWIGGIGMIVRGYEILMGKSTATGDAMIAKGDEITARAKQNALDFESNTIKAVENAAKTHQDRFNDTAEKSRIAYEDMSKSGKASADQIKDAFIKYASDTIKANDNVIDARLKTELAEKGLQAEVDKSGKISVKAMNDSALAAQNQEAATSKARTAAQNLGLDLDVMLNRVSRGFKDGGSALDRFELGLKGLGFSGKQAGEATFEAWQKWLATAKNPAEVEQARTKLVQFGTDGKIAADKVAEGMLLLGNKTREVDPQFVKLQESAKALGVNLSAALNQVTSKFNQSALALEDFSAGLAKTGTVGTQASNALYTAWTGFLKAAGNQAEIDLAKSKLEEMGKAGKLSTQQVEQGMIAIKQQAQEVAGAIDPVAQAFERLGIKSRDSLKLAAQQQLADLDTVTRSGKATQDSLQQASEKAVQAAIASGDAATIAAAKTRAAANGLAVTTDATGKTVVQTYADMDAAAEKHANTVVGTVGGAYHAMGQTARDEAASAEQAWNAVLDKKLESQAADQDRRRKDGIMNSDSAITYDYIKGLLEKQGVQSDQLGTQIKKIMDSARARDRALASKASGWAKDQWDAFLKTGQISNNQYDFVREATGNIILGRGTTTSSSRKNQENTTASEEVIRLQRELDMQKQINDEQKQRQQVAFSQSGGEYTAAAELIADQIRQIRDGAITDFMQTLQNELKRLAR